LQAGRLRPPTDRAARGGGERRGALAQLAGGKKGRDRWAGRGPGLGGEARAVGPQPRDRGRGRATRATPGSAAGRAGSRGGGRSGGEPMLNGAHVHLVIAPEQDADRLTNRQGIVDDENAVKRHSTLLPPPPDPTDFRRCCLCAAYRERSEKVNTFLPL